jgi:hypothetical protein
MSFGTESATPIGGQTLTGFIVSKAMQSRKGAKKEDRKEKRKEKKEQQTKKENKQQQKQGASNKLLGSFPSLGNLFSFKKAPTKSQENNSSARTSGGTTGLAKILTQGFGSLTADTMGLASGLASVTQVLNSSLRAQTFTATGVQTIASILSDQVENQGSILSTVKSLKPGGGSGGGGKSMFGSSKSKGTGGDTLTGFLIQQAIDRGIGRFIRGGLSKILDPFRKLIPGKPAASAGTKVATEGAEAAARKKLAKEITEKGLSSKGAIIGGKYISMTAAEAAQSLAPKAATGPLAKMGGMFTGMGAKLGLKGGGNLASRIIPGAQTAVGLGLAGKELLEGDYVGAGLAGLSAIPGPIGWTFLGADVAREVAGPESTDKMIGQAFSGDIGLSDADIEKKYTQQSALQRAFTSPSISNLGFSQGGVMLGEAGKEAVVDLNSDKGKKIVGQKSEDPGMKASGASTLAVIDQFIKGMGYLGAPVSQALGPDIQNLSRTFGMSQTLPNLKMGGGKFREDGSAKKTRDKFLEDLISGSLKALDAKKKDDKKSEPSTTPPPTGDPNAERSKSRQEETKNLLESIPGAGKAMERPTPEGIQRAQGEQAFVTENKVKGTQVQIASGDKIMVPSADLNPVTNSNKKYWYDNNGNIYRWNPGEQVTQVYLDEIQKQGKSDGFDLVRNLNNGVVRKISVKSDWNPFNDGSPLSNGEYSYRANDKLIDNRNKTPVWYRSTEKQDLEGLHGPSISIPKQSNLTQFQKGGKVEQKPWWDFMGRFVDNHRNTKSTDYSNQQGLGANFARQREAFKELGYEKGGSMFGTELSNAVPLEKRVKALEDIISVTAITSAAEPKRPAPRTAPASAPIGATAEASSDMSSAAIINIVSGMGGGASVPTSQESPQSSSDYISDPWPGGLAGVLCSSPWSAV